jgi:hypothetical protein
MTTPFRLVTLDLVATPNHPKNMESIEAVNRCSLQETSTTRFATRKLNAFEFMWIYVMLYILFSVYYFLQSACRDHSAVKTRIFQISAAGDHHQLRIVHFNAFQN